MTAPSATGPILVVYPFCLDHVGHGNIQRILAIARYLAGRGYPVDLVYQGSPTVPRVEAQYHGFRRVIAVEGGAGSSEAASCAARLEAFYSGRELPPIHMRPSAPLTTLVRALIEAESYRAVVATYAFTAPILAGLRRRVFTICDVQDVMHEHSEACARATGRASSFTMPPDTEAFLWRQWDALVAITPDDEARMRRDVTPGQYLVSARHASRCAAAAVPGADDVALYAASDNQSNAQAAVWLLGEVWPRVRQARPGARLRMAGLICNVLPDTLRATPGLELLGFRDDISDDLAAAGVIVAPYLYGSGLKIKVVEAACAGKAVVTTSSGLAGTGLTMGRAIEAHDDPGAFAEVLSALLADGRRRAVLASRALEEASACFSEEACYEPIDFLIRVHGTQALASASAGLSPAALDRALAVVEHVRPARVVVWGNGAFTRALVPALSAKGPAADLIVDGRAPVPGVSVEGITVLPKASYTYAAGDLIVLASETFEAEMWRDLAACRDAGGDVLGLCHVSFVSRALLGRLPGSVRRVLHAGAPATTRSGTAAGVVLWDGGATAERWWRLCRLHALAGAVARHGLQAVVAVPRTLAGRGDVLDAFDGRSQVLPVIELDGRALDHAGAEDGARGLARTAALLAAVSSEAVSRLALSSDDRVVLLEPSLADFLAMSRLLAHRPSPSGSPIVAWISDLAAPGMSAAEAAAHWRLAVHDLRAAGTPLGLVTTDSRTAAVLSRELQTAVVALGHPVEAADHRNRDRYPSIVCLGSMPDRPARAILSRLVEATSAGGTLAGMTLAWRSDQQGRSTDGGLRGSRGPATLPGIHLLDGAPLAVGEAIAGASVVVLLDAPDETWAPAARAIAAASGVPVLAPAGPGDAVALVRAALVGGRLASGGDTASHVLDCLLRSAGGDADPRSRACAFTGPSAAAPRASLGALAMEIPS